MKLRTEMVQFLGANILLKPSLNERETADALEHDAMCAHVLMQAVSEAKNKWFITQSDHSHWIKQRADELMREWTGEVG